MPGHRNCRAGHSAGVTAVAALLALSLMAPATARTSDDDEFQRPQTGSRQMVARAASSGGKVTVSGWATFSGQIMAGTKDPDDDATVGGEANGAEIIGSDFIYRPENEDFFFRLEVTKIPTSPVGVGGVSLAGSPLTLYGLRFTAKQVHYEIRAHRLGSVDPGAALDSPGGHVFGLFRCEEDLCFEVAPLKGGYGTTGERIVVALPLEVLKEDDTNIKEGDRIGGLLAFTANHPFQGKVDPSLIWDEARLTRQASVVVPKKSVKVTVGKRTVNAKLKDGYFDATFPKSLFRKSPTTVKTRTCLGKACKRQQFKVRA